MMGEVGATAAPFLSQRVRVIGCRLAVCPALRCPQCSALDSGEGAGVPPPMEQVAYSEG